MKNKYRRFACGLAVAFVPFGAQAETINWDGEAGNGLWSAPTNWSTDTVPGEADTAQYIGAPTFTTITVDTHATIAQFTLTAPSTTDLTLAAGGGTLTLTNGTTANGWALRLLSNTDVDVTATIEAPLTINNPSGAICWATSANRAGNLLRIGGPLNLQTHLEFRNSGTVTGPVELAGPMTGPGSLRISNMNVFLESGHDSTASEGTFVILGDATSITIEEGARVLNSSSKIQNNSNTGNAKLILNGADVLNGPNLQSSATGVLQVDVNAAQPNVGWVGLNTGGSFIFNLVAGQPIWFADSSGSAWGSGSLTISGFQEGLVRFGKNKLGLTDTQLAQITISGSPGPLYLDYDGYLTAIEPVANPVRDLFPDASVHADSWYNVDWIASGWILDADFPWLLSLEHGWWWAGAATADLYWFYDLSLGWIYASPSNPNFYYRAGDGAWLYHQPETGVYGQGRLLYNYTTQAWETP